MPGGDRTGPLGMGPMTGRAAGYCAGYNMPGYMNPYVGSGQGRGRGFGQGSGMGRGRGWGRGFGRGRGMGFGWPGLYPYANPPYQYGPYAPPAGGASAPEDEMGFLKEQAEAIQGELKAINERIEELSKEAKEKK